MQANALAHHERADSLGSTELVAAQRDELGRGAHLAHVHPRERLNGVAVEDGVRRPLGHDLGDGGQRLDGADLVVDGHDRHQRDPRVQRAGKLIEVDDAARVDGEHAALQVLDRVQHSVVLDRRASDDPSLCCVHSEDRRVVRFGAVAHEDDLARVDTETAGDDLASLVERLTGGAGSAMSARGVAVSLGEERQHRLDGLGPHGRARRMVEVGELVGHGERVRGPGQLGGANSPGSEGTRAPSSGCGDESSGDGMPGSAIAGGGNVPPIVRLRS